MGWHDFENEDAETSDSNPIYLRAAANDPLTFVQSLTIHSPTLQTIIFDINIQNDINATAWKIVRNKRGMHILGPKGDYLRVMDKEGMRKLDWWRKSLAVVYFASIISW